MRKIHRILGLIIGLQFLFWTISGIYFSWTDIHSVRSSDWVDPSGQIDHSIPILYPHEAIETLRNSENLNQIYKVQLLPGPFTPIFEIQYSVFNQGQKPNRVVLVDALTETLRAPINESEARKIAQNAYLKDHPIKSVELIENVHSHHEYRTMPLPAYAVTFDDSRATTIYVSPAHGRITSVRNNKWRVFDFLWMLHTMDYLNRDNFNNYQIKGFSIFGLFVIVSGLVLLYFTTKGRWRRSF